MMRGSLGAGAVWTGVGFAWTRVSSCNVTGAARSGTITRNCFETGNFTSFNTPFKGVYKLANSGSKWGKCRGRGWVRAGAHVVGQLQRAAAITKTHRCIVPDL